MYSVKLGPCYLKRLNEYVELHKVLYEHKAWSYIPSVQWRYRWCIDSIIALIPTTYQNSTLVNSKPYFDDRTEDLMFGMSTKYLRYDFIYIGEMDNSIRTVTQEGSSFTTPGNLRTFALVGYVCGFGNNKDLRV
jgi:hypothetical protein